MLILMLKQLNLSQSITGCYILHKINLTGPAPRGACNKPASQLPASWVSSCKSKGRMKRTGSRNEKIGGRTQKVAGKRIKGQKYGGPLPDYSK